MLWTALLLASAPGHTPQSFITECPEADHPYHMHDVNVSQVHYIRLYPDCPVTFVQSGPDCSYETLSIGRFSTASGNVLLQIDNHTSRLESAPLHIGIEPFTTTPSVKTHEINETIHGCNIRISSPMEDTVYFVSGKAEEWWLFATIPLYAYMIQWHWAFVEPPLPIFWWPWLGYVALWWVAYRRLKYNADAQRAEEIKYQSMLTLWRYMFVVDIMVPTIASCVAVKTFPGDSFWLIVFFVRLFVALLVWVWISNRKQPRQWDWLFFWRWTSVRNCAGCSTWTPSLDRWDYSWLLILSLFTTAFGIGGYVLVPALVYIARVSRTSDRPPQGKYVELVKQGKLVEQGEQQASAMHMARSALIF